MSEFPFSHAALSASGWGCRGISGELLSQLAMVRAWQGEECLPRIDNIGGADCAIAEVVLYSIEHRLPDTVRVLGDGFQMLAQTAGTLGDLKPIGRCPDGYVYRLFDEDRERRLYNYMVLGLAENHFCLLGFTACHRFSGFFRIGSNRIDVVLDTEGCHLAPAQHWLLEPICVLQSDSYPQLMKDYAALIQNNHPRALPHSVPTGWCSWYHYYAEVTAEDIQENIAAIRQGWPEMEYVLLDDGYQAHMGDWLLPSSKFAGGVKRVIDAIKAAGLKPALWVAPFIAEPDSELFRHHPDWFVTGADGHPLAAETVTYGGWRCTPWYVLDGTHPEVQSHLFRLFSILKNEWGIDYFKLDANFWGAIHGGQFHDQGCTRIQAYRAGMEAINRAMGNTGILLGCNAPMWPSLGLVDAMRVSDDVERNRDRFVQIAWETFARAWQHKRLWLNDPDCVTLADLPAQQAQPGDYALHRDVLLASGGLMFSGDRLKTLSSKAQGILRKLLQTNREQGSAIQFTDLTLQQGQAEVGDDQLLFGFNFSAEPRTFSFDCPPGAQITDFWEEMSLESSGGEKWTTPALPPYSSGVYRLRRKPD